MIVLMAGLPASGKSTVCGTLARRLGGAILDKDKIRKALFSPPDIEYATEQDDFCMKLALEAAAYILEKNPSRFVFLDGRPFSRTYQIEDVLMVASALKQEWRILECVCSEETARKRLGDHAASHKHPAANRNYELYRTIKSQFEEIRHSKTIIDTNQPLEISVRRSMEALGQVCEDNS